MRILYLCRQIVSRMTKILVIHAASLKERGEHIDKMLKGMGLDYEFIKDADCDMLTDELLDRYVADGPEQMHEKSGKASCTIKHFMACERVLEEGLEGALVLEDDMVLHKDFVKRFEACMTEYEAHYQQESILISLEDSSLRFVPRSRRRKGQLLYDADKGRMAGAYYVNRHACQAIVDSLKEERCKIPIDHYHNLLIKRGAIRCLWCQPALATQGSFMGLFGSSLSKRSDRMIKRRWLFKKNYKKILYWFR